MSIINMVGGGAGLNISVKAYPSESVMLASTPKENTIGVVTESMTDWAMGFTTPETAADGLVFIKLGTDSRVAMSASASKNVAVCPLNARIRDGESWESIQMMAFQGGAWVSPWIVFVQNKVEIEELTLANLAVWNENGLELSTSTTSGSRAAAFAKINFDNISKLRMTAYTNSTTAATTRNLRLGITDVTGNIIDMIAFTDCRVATAGTEEFVFDCSKYVGEHYLQVIAQSSAASAKVTARVIDLRAEP